MACFPRLRRIPTTLKPQSKYQNAFLNSARTRPLSLSGHCRLGTSTRLGQVRCTEDAQLIAARPRPTPGRRARVAATTTHTSAINGLHAIVNERTAIGINGSATAEDRYRKRSPRLRRRPAR